MRIDCRGVKSGSVEYLIEVSCRMLVCFVEVVSEVQQPTMNNTTECFLYEGILSQHEVHASESVAIEVCT